MQSELLVLLFLLLSGLAGTALLLRKRAHRRRFSPWYCRTKYPVVLVHGLGRRENDPFLSYWGSIPDDLRRCGGNIYICRQDAFGTVETNARLIRETVERAHRESRTGKVNIIAFSKGGIDARNYICSGGGKGHVASLVSIAVPHRGMYLAEYLIDQLPDSGGVIDDLLEMFFQFLGDESPDVMAALRQLTRENMAVFNRSCPDEPSVRYLSYSGQLGEKYGNPFWKRLNELLYPEEGPNDGFVSLASAEWGDFTIVEKHDRKGISHADIAGISEFSWGNGFDASSFFKNILHRLKKEGF